MGMEFAIGVMVRVDVDVLIVMGKVIYQIFIRNTPYHLFPRLPQLRVERKGDYKAPANN